MLRKLLNTVCIIAIIYLAQAGFSGCIKEYSFEGGQPINNPIPIPDTAVRPGISFPFCAGCRNMDDFNLTGWSFKYDTSILCGTVTDAVITPGRNGFTFFGPSSCSRDTGLVMTVFLDSGALDSDKFNVTPNRVSLEYYDNTTHSDIFVSSRLFSLSFTIDTYEHATGIANGRFSGNVKTKDSTVAAIKDGKFKIKLKR